ncbi:MAG TPA: HNH endonuclease domain-containing protein, partial [Verrucomicrobiae bacterium]|nr:HNH endonuclease domain-containing protein [Verrucomicrobiae bacterium]
KKDIGSDTKGVLGSIKAQHYRVKAWLEDGLKGSHWENAVNAKLIWKGKVADDLGRRCPYTGMEIHPADLASGAMDIDHIIPKSQRLTNAMEAVVITYKQINAMKGARTSWQFINECGGEKVSGTNFELRRLTGPNGYEQCVKNLKTHGSGKASADEKDGDDSDDKKGHKLSPMYLPGTKKKHPDYIRRKKRKGFLLVKKYDKDKERFTPRDLTVTSHINRLTQQALLKNLPHLGPENIVAIPGTVTGTLRDAKGWRLLGCLQAACGDEVMREVIIKDKKTGKPKQIKVVKPKGEIRNITHLHHAVDACALGLMAHFIPKDGKLWELLALKELTDAEKKLWEKSAEDNKWKGYPLNELFTICEITGSDERLSPDPDRKWRLEPKTDGWNRSRMNRIKEQIRQHLGEKRVVQHIPARLDGLQVEQNIWRAFPPNEEGNVAIQQRIRQPDGTLPPPKNSQEKATRLLGLKPSDGKGKLATNKGVLVIPDNFGVAILDNAKDETDKLVIIPWHLVHTRIFKGFKDKNGVLLEKSLIERNGGKMPRLIRNGQIIRVPGGKNFKGVWKVFSAKNNATGVALDIGWPDVVKLKNKTEGHKINVRLETLVKDGLEVIHTPLTGIAACPTTSSA